MDSLTQQMVVAIRKVVRCEHRYATGYQFVVEGEYLPAGGRQQVVILGRRCPDCGAIESKHVPWVLPHEVKALGELLEKIQGEEEFEEPGVTAEDAAR